METYWFVVIFDAHYEVWDGTADGDSQKVSFRRIVNHRDSDNLYTILLVLEHFILKELKSQKADIKRIDFEVLCLGEVSEDPEKAKVIQDKISEIFKTKIKEGKCSFYKERFIVDK